MSDTLRLFVAIELPEAVTQHIGEIIGRFRQQELPGIRWVRPQAVHLTLKFLGNVPESQVQAIVGAMQTAATVAAPFLLQVQGLGVFPHPRSPRVLWVGVQGNLEPLVQIHERLEEALEAQGFTRDQRGFSPHLTLARMKGRLSAPELQRLSQTIDCLQKVGTTELPVTELSLIESHLSREGAVYRRKAQSVLRNGLAGSFGS